MPRRGLLFALLLFAPWPVSAQTLQPGWIADIRTGCQAWNAAPVPNETISWTGACPNGFTQGHGVLQWFLNGKPNGRYEGEFRDGKRNGRGVITFASGARYEGEFRDDKFNGRGVYTSANGDRYDGEHRDDKLNGRGVITSANGNRYEGEFRDGKRNGRGVITFANGNRYEGEFRNGKPNGYGVFTFANALYRGQWVNGCYRDADNRVAWVDATEQDCRSQSLPANPSPPWHQHLTLLSFPLKRYWRRLVMIPALPMVSLDPRQVPQ